MRTLIFGLLLLVTIAGFSQERQVFVLNNEKTVGKNLVDNSEITGVEYVFPKRIHESFIDTTTGLLTVQLRGVRKQKWLDNKGDIVQYDTKNSRVLWNKKIFYESSYLQQFSKAMIYTVGNKSYCLDIYRGNDIWEVKNNIYFVDPVDYIGIGYKFKSSTGYSNILEGIDLTNGNVIWKRELNREYGWNNLFYTNDSTLIVVAAGLHSVNIRTGKGWDYNAVTGKKDYTGTAIANAAGVGLGLLTGTFALSTGHDLIRELVSNTLTDSANIYFASKDELVRVDKQSGEIVWKSQFPDNTAGKSSIFMIDSMLYMINKGMAFMGNRQLAFGKPFIAAFDRQSGNQKFFSLLDVKDDPILYYKVKNKEFLLVFKNRIARYSMETGMLISERIFLTDHVGELLYFVGDQVYITDQNGELMSLYSDSAKVFVYTSKSKILAVDEELNISRTIEFDELSVYYIKTKDFKFFAKDKKTLVVDNTGKQVAELDATSNAVLIGNILYDTQENSYIAIDLSPLLRQGS